MKQPISLKKQIEETTAIIKKSDVVTQLNKDLEEVKQMVAQGEEDSDDWIGTLNSLKAAPEKLIEETERRTREPYKLAPEVLNSIISDLNTRLTPGIKASSNVLVIWNTEFDHLLYNFHSANSHKELLTEYGDDINGELIGDYSIHGTPIQEMEFWEDPIEVDELFMSLDSEYFSEVIWIRHLRIYQAILQNISGHLSAEHSDFEVTVLIGKQGDHLFCT